MTTKTTLGLFTIGALVLGAIIYAVTWSKSGDNGQMQTKIDPLNATYTIEQRQVKLSAGKAEQEIVPGSASKMITLVFGTPTVGDLNNDGRADAALLLTQNGGGSGTFYFAAAALQQVSGDYIGTNSLFLGDRIAPQNVELRAGKFIVNYAERAANEPMATAPSIGKSMFLQVVGTTLQQTTD